MANTQSKYYTQQPPSAWTTGAVLNNGSYEVDSDNLAAALTVLNDTRDLFRLPDKTRLLRATQWQKLNDIDATATATYDLKVKNAAGTTTHTLITGATVTDLGVETTESASGEPLLHVLDDGTGDDWIVFVTVATGAATPGTVGEYAAHIEYDLNVLNETPS